MNTKYSPRKFILIASGNIFSTCLIKVIEIYTHIDVLFIAFDQINKEISLLKKPGLHIITIILNLM